MKPGEIHPVNLRSSIVGLMISGFLAVGAAQAREEVTADKVLVDKSDRLLYLLRDGRVWKSYPIGLGFSPRGHKKRQGDGRTPEGDYVLDWRNPQSSFYLSIHISYPNDDDRAQAWSRGVSPGGDIFIHGRHSPSARKRDWTWGCIAVTDAAMNEIWAAVPNGTPITIRP